MSLNRFTVIQLAIRCWTIQSTCRSAILATFTAGKTIINCYFVRCLLKFRRYSSIDRIAPYVPRSWRVGQPIVAPEWPGMLISRVSSLMIDFVCLIVGSVYSWKKWREWWQTAQPGMCLYLFSFEDFNFSTFDFSNFSDRFARSIAVLVRRSILHRTSIAVCRGWSHSIWRIKNDEIIKLLYCVSTNSYYLHIFFIIYFSHFFQAQNQFICMLL